MIRIDELRQASNLLFDELEKKYGEHIDVDNDYYWQIPKEKRYNPNETPLVDGLGQTSWDIEDLQKLVKDKDVILFYHLEKLGEVLRAISAEQK